MPLIKIWIHAVWTTKYRYPFLTEPFKALVIDHILKNAALKKIEVDSINGYRDHLHCLIELRPSQAIADVIHAIKGESAFWINKEQLTEERFAWQSQYYAASVSESHLAVVRKYIKNQVQHHQKKDVKLKLMDVKNLLEPED